MAGSDKNFSIQRGKSSPLPGDSGADEDLLVRCEPPQSNVEE